MKNPKIAIFPEIAISGSAAPGPKGPLNNAAGCLDVRRKYDARTIPMNSSNYLMKRTRCIARIGCILQGPSFQDNLLGWNGARLENLRPAVREIAIAKDETLLTCAELPCNRPKLYQ